MDLFLTTGVLFCNDGTYGTIPYHHTHSVKDNEIPNEGGLFNDYYRTAYSIVKWMGLALTGNWEGGGRYGTYLADMGTLGRQAGIVGVYNKSARIDRVLLHFTPIPFVCLSVQ